MKSEEVLKASDLCKNYSQGDRKVQVLDGVNLELAQGETMAVVGVSGCGKSTLLHLLAGLDQPDSGSIRLAGHELTTMSQTELGQVRNDHLGFVYQFHHLLPEFNALENVALPLRIGGMDKEESLSVAEQMLDRVGLNQRASHHPGELSGGERQRVAIARALVKTPDLVLADEPTGNLDEGTAQQIQDVMMELSRQMSVAFIVVTHNSAMANRMDRVCQLHGGQLEEMK